MARKRKIAVALHDGDNIIVTPADQRAGADATSPSSSSLLAPSSSITTNNNQASAMAESPRDQVNNQLAQGTASGLTSTDNLWTQQEKYELLKVRRDFPNHNRDGRAFYLDQEMTKIRNRTGEPQQPKRSGPEISSMIRELENSHVTLEDLEAELNPPEPKKKKATTMNETTTKGKAGGKRRGKANKKKTTYEPDRFYPAKAIVEEAGGKYKISWEHDKETGEVFEDSWEPREYATQDLVDAWEQQKKGGEDNNV